eukprot:7729108-Lingulodinium_polyedra.AAC.2
MQAGSYALHGTILRLVSVGVVEPWVAVTANAVRQVPGHMVLVVEVAAVSTPERQEHLHVLLECRHSLLGHHARLAGHELVHGHQAAAGTTQE